MEQLPLLQTIAIIVTLTGTVWAYAAAKNNIYQSNITNYRLKWIDALRELVSGFCTYSMLYINHEPIAL